MLYIVVTEELYFHQVRSGELISLLIPNRFFRASSKVKVTSLRTSWAVKEKRRAELNSIKERARAAKAERDEAYKAEAARIKASRARREANSLKNVKYQVVTNTAKLKRLTKDQKKKFMKLADINK